jgi:hypothetical protein
VLSTHLKPAVNSEKLARSIRSIDKVKVSSALQIAEEMLDCLPISWARVAGEAREHSIPHPGCLIQAIQRLPQLKNMARLALLKAIRLLHIDFLHQITIKESIGDVDRVSLPVLEDTDG